MMDDLPVAVLSLAGCVFAASAAAKLRGREAYRSFSDGLRETALAPVRLIGATAAALAGVEAAVTVGLLAAAVLSAFGWPGASTAGELALACAGGLTVVLAAGVAAVIRRGTRARCNCFGAGSGRPLGRAHLVRNLSLLAVIAVGLVGVPLAHGRPALVAAGLAAVAGALVAQLFIRWDDLAELFAPIPSSPATAAAPAHLHREHG